MEDKGPNDEGVVAKYIGNAWMPLVGADMKRIDSLRPIAGSIATNANKKVTLARFSNRTDLETIEP